MAYVYTHTRLDKEVIFYVGIGSDELYKRAFSIQGRNRHWYSVVRRADYRVNILCDEITWEEACKKEIELIEEFGRRNDGGILVNQTKGGEGFKSNHSQKTKDQIRDFFIGKSYEDIYGEERASTQRANRKRSVEKVWQNRSLEERKAIAAKNSKPIIQYEKDGTFIREWQSSSEARVALKIPGISHCLNGRHKTSGGFIWKYKK